MNYLLDTCVFIWAMSDPNQLSKKIKNIIEDCSSNIYISSVTPWEMSIKKSIGKLNCPDNIEEVIKLNDFKELPITFKHTSELKKLPPHHNDPFDRMLISQARIENLTILTNDEKILAYEVKVKS